MESFKSLSKLCAFVCLGLSLTACLSTNGSGSESGTNVDVITPPSYDPNRTACDPFANQTFPERGLFGRLYYLNPEQPRYGRVVDYLANGNLFDADLFFNRLNVPTRPFDRGFTLLNGETIKTEQGSTLYEYFALSFRTNIKLAPDQPAGYYQFALLSDDGAIMRLASPDGSGQMIVDNDGTHPTRMGCGMTPVFMEAGGQLPVEISYYQGPRYHIALMLMMRPWPEAPDESGADPLCGRAGNSFFFDSTKTPPEPSANYYSLLDRGWRVLENANYDLPTNGMNPCAGAEDPLEIFNVSFTGITRESVTVTWNTNIPADSLVEYRVANPNAPWTALPLDGSLVQSHSIFIPGLTANTLYTVRVTSKSAGGQVVVGDERTVRTLR